MSDATRAPAPERDTRTPPHPLAPCAAASSPPSRRIARGARLWHVVGVVLGCCVLAVALLPIGPTAEDYLAAAARASAGLRYDRALADYARASALAPTDARPSCLSGDVLALQAVWAAAIAADHRCTVRDPANPGGWLALGDALAAANAPAAAAAAAWTHAARLGDSTALRRLATQEEQAGDLTVAATTWGRLPAHDPQAAAHLGLLALARGAWDSAARHIAVVCAQPNATCLWVEQNGFAALAAQGPAAPEVTLGMVGYHLLGIGAPALAIVPLRAALRLAPRDGVARGFLGWAEWQTGARVAARADVALAVRLAPSQSFNWFASGELAAATGQLGMALANLRQGLLLDSRNAVLWAAAGQVELALHDYVDAELALQAAAQLASDPGATASWLQFYLDTRVGLTDGRALLAANTAVALWPESAAVQVRAGELYALVNQPTPAYYALVRANQLDPHDPGPYVFLARYAEQDGQYVQAALDLRTALALRPDGPYAAQASALLAPLASINV